MDRFRISKESDLETIQSSIQAYRYSWLRLYIDIPVPNLTIKSIYLSYIPKEQDKDIILIDRFEPVMLYRKDNSLRLNGAAIAYLSIKGKDENEINQMIKSSTLIARIEYQGSFFCEAVGDCILIDGYSEMLYNDSRRIIPAVHSKTASLSR